MVPLADLEQAAVVVLKKDYRGKLVVEVILGRGAVGSQPTWWIFTLIHKGHMLLLEPPRDLDPRTWVAQTSTTTTPALGWQWFYDQRHGALTAAPGAVNCRLCKGRKGGNGCRP